MSAQVFDGDAEGKVYDAFIAIGAQRVARPDELALPGGETLKGLKAWPMTLTYYERGASEELPVYEASFALFENGRESVTITIDEVSPFTVGALIALFERTVGLYAFLIHINAYHQPGVEAGKKAAGRVLELQAKVLAALRSGKGKTFDADELAAAAGSDDPETVFKICQHLAANGRGIVQSGTGTGIAARFAAA